jgi:C-terminal processing protease CtpA/Prc
VYGGVDVDTGDKSQGVVRIKKVFPLGPAISSQQIQRDDVLLEVNGVPVKGLTHAVSLLDDQGQGEKHTINNFFTKISKSQNYMLVNTILSLCD